MSGRDRMREFTERNPWVLAVIGVPFFGALALIEAVRVTDASNARGDLGWPILLGAVAGLALSAGMTWYAVNRARFSDVTQVWATRLGYLGALASLVAFQWQNPRVGSAPEPTPLGVTVLSFLAVLFGAGVFAALIVPAQRAQSNDGDLAVTEDSDNRLPQDNGKPEVLSPKFRLFLGVLGTVLFLVLAGAGLREYLIHRDDPELARTPGTLLEAVPEFADAVASSDLATYTATYRTANGAQVHVVQDPERLAYQGTRETMIRTREAHYLCQRDARRTTCQQAALTFMDRTFLPNEVGSRLGVPPSASALQMVSQEGYGGTARLKQSVRRIADVTVKCVSMPSGAVNGKRPQQDMEMCITDDGVLASLKGSFFVAGTFDVELVSLRKAADPAAFVLPVGAAITVVPQIARGCCGLPVTPPSADPSTPPTDAPPN